MRILFISSLSHSASTGPNYSVPSRILAQSKYDTVFWINLSTVAREEWQRQSHFHSIDEIGILTLEEIEKVFPNIDIVVFEGFYIMGQVRLARQLVRNKIPYVIVPRGSLTQSALHNHSWLKKKIAHWLYFNKFCKEASSIQYLTKREYQDSGDSWNKRHFIIPNGCTIHDFTDVHTVHEGIKMVFIGRIDIYHKGLDLLLKASSDLKEMMLKHKVSVVIYGPKLEDYYKVEKLINDLRVGDFVRMGGEVLGEEKEKVLKETDIFILTSRFEGHPMGLIEALSYGIPAIVTPGTNMADEISGANAGWVCDTNVEGIKNVLEEILCGCTDMNEKRKNAHNLASNYEWDSLALEFHNRVKQLLGKEN